MRRVKAMVPILALLASLVLPASLSGHALAPSLLELQEQDGGQVHMLWKISMLNQRAGTLVPRLSPDCSGFTPGWAGAPAAEQETGALLRRYTLDCSEGGLAGRQVSISGLDGVESSVLLRVVLADGATARAVLRGGDPPFAVNSSPTLLDTAGDYLVLGFEHILGGFDHLLFVLGLLFLIESRRMLLLTVTAFTAGHSVTLSLATLDLVRLPSGPVELAIAASIWIVALELAHKDRRRSSWAGRRPWADGRRLRPVARLRLRRRPGRSRAARGRHPSGPAVVQRRHRARSAGLHRGRSGGALDPDGDSMANARRFVVETLRPGVARPTHGARGLLPDRRAGDLLVPGARR